MGADISSQQDFQFEELLFKTSSGDGGVEAHSAKIADEEVTVFTYEGTKRDLNRVAQYHKTLRHPFILKYVTSKRVSGQEHVVTEVGTPLSLCLQYMDGWEVSAGLHSVLTVLEFLHQSVGVSHNNINQDSIFVTPNGQWKIARLECLQKFSDNTAEYLKSVEHFCDEELSAHSKLPVGHSRDMYSFGKLCESLSEKLDVLAGDALDSFNDCIDLLLSAEPKDVLSAKEVLKQQLFLNDLVTSIQFLSCLPVCSKREKDDFFVGLLDKLKTLPEIVVAKLLVKPLLRRFVLENEIACCKIMPHLFIPNFTGTSASGRFSGLLSPELYKKYMIPVISRLFTVRETRVRRLLLVYFEQYCHLFEHDTLQYNVMPLIIQGLHDVHEDIVATTLVAISQIVPVLGGAIVIGTERRAIFSDVQPNEFKIVSPIHTCKAHYGKLSEAVSQEQSGATTARDNLRHKNNVIPNHSTKSQQSTRSTINNTSRKQTHALKLGTRAKRDSMNSAHETTNTPDAEAQVGSLPTATAIAMNDNDHWSNDDGSDWEDFGSPTKETRDPRDPIDPIAANIDNSQQTFQTKTQQKIKPINDDFSSLDIKSSAKTIAGDTDNFFADIAPTILISQRPYETNKKVLPTQKSQFSSVTSNNAFAMEPPGEVSGWGEEDDWDW